MNTKQVSLESKDCKYKHRWYDVIVAWANGEKIQCNDTRFQPKWIDYDSSCTPDFCDGYFEWRVKPKTITKKYRMALVDDEYHGKRDLSLFSLDFPAEREVQGFIRWVGDIVEVEIESD